MSLRRPSRPKPAKLEPMNSENERPSAGESFHGHRTFPRAINTKLAHHGTSFLDEETPVEPKSRDHRDTDFDRARDRDRDSHDLSLTSITRDSVVDNMLLSLDQLGGGISPFANFATFSSSFGGAPFSNHDDDPFSPTSDGPVHSRNRGHTYTSSYSSDFDLHQDDPSSRYHLRGRRSNSSSNFQTNLHRVESLQRPYKSAQHNGTTGKGKAAADAASKYSAHRRGGSKMGSKGSGSSSFDHGYSHALSGSQRSGRLSRTASFDQAYANSSRPSPFKQYSTPNALALVDSNEHPNHLLYNDYEAAPTPTVPAGPRRFYQEASVSPPLYQPQPIFPSPPQQPQTSAGGASGGGGSSSNAPTRRNSIRSATSRSGKKGKVSAQPQVPDASIRAQATEFYNQAQLRELPPVPTVYAAEPPAPSPTVALRKLSASSPASTSKEKPGFFRRMFGSFARDHQPVPESASADPRTMPAPVVDMRPKSTQANGPYTGSSNSKPLPHAPQEPRTVTSASDGPPRREAAHTLTKKGSSFFRRRKKSISDDIAPPPVVPMQYQQQQPPASPPMPRREQVRSLSPDYGKSSEYGSPEYKPPEFRSHDFIPAQDSPSISSLRKVMDPYLTLSFGHEGEDSYMDDLDDRLAETKATSREGGSGFSPGYKPHRDATIRAVDPGSRPTETSAPSSRSDEVRASAARDPNSPKLKLKVKRGRISNPVGHDDTFLADSSSGNEDKGTLSPSSASPPFGLPNDSKRPSTSPTSSSLSTRSPMLLADLSSPSHSKAPSGEKRLRLSPSQPSGIGKHSIIEDDVRDEDEDELVITNASRKDDVSSAHAAASNRLWLEPQSDDEKLEESSRLSLPIEGVRVPSKAPSADQISTSTSPSERFHSATSLPIVQVEGGQVQEPSSDSEPTEEDRERAEKIFDGDEEFISKARAAAWLGETTPVSRRTRQAYMELYDWTGYNILAAMRDLCQRLHLKGETQQVDRIIDAFAQRWAECNPNHGFRTTDVVHAICYSILLLNTDLHIADIEQKMTRAQFVKNTLPTIKRLVADAEAATEAAEDTVRQNTAHGRAPLPWGGTNSPVGRNSPTMGLDNSEERPSLEVKRSRNRLSIKPSARSDSDGHSTTHSTPVDNCNVLVYAPFIGSAKGWEFQVEIVLKEFYNSIRQQRLPLHGSNSGPSNESSANNLTVSSMLRRTPSVLSKAPSESHSYRGRTPDFRSAGPRWNSKPRSRPRLYPTSTIGSSRTSLDEQSFWSPAGSSTWSKYSIGKTQASMMSVESFGSHFATGDFQQSIGFANALSQAIIREEGAPMPSADEFGGRTVPLLEDESLELAGAPWAKEGILKHKHHLEAFEKKAKDRHWTECFAVIEKGYMRLFSFNTHKSVRTKNRSRRPSAPGGVVGGGNWTENAEDLGQFILRHTIASALPPPGYSKARPHVWALSLPTGAVHFFQAGTPDIVREFVSTANYWSARLSKEPLVGGVSNIEYGWSEAVINTALLPSHSNQPSSSHSQKNSLSGVGMPRPSMQSSIRSSLDHATGAIKPRLPGDKVAISDWQPPAQSLMASNLMEVDQKKALERYVASVEKELAKHQELRPAMQIAFSPRHPNCAKASANWERKSSYLLREIVKYRTYIENLNIAQATKERIYKERGITGDTIGDTHQMSGEQSVKQGAEEDDPTRSGSCPVP